MVFYDNQVIPFELPTTFCWTKFGAEAGEGPETIMGRKDIERRRNGGVFLWGIGNSITPSLSVLLRATSSPRVLFSPMKSSPAPRDAAPVELALWCGGVGLDGTQFTQPRFSLVTSRADASRHFALVCQSEVPLTNARSIGSLSSRQLRNLRSGAALGSSQVTSIVRREFDSSRAGIEDYPIAGHAQLVYPYLVRLTSPIRVPSALRIDRLAGDAHESAVEDLIELRKRSGVANQEQFVLG